MSEFAYYEYTARLTDTGRDERHNNKTGDVLRCVAKVSVVDPYGRARAETELSETAADLILMTINPGPGKRMGQFNIRRISEEAFAAFAPPNSTRDVGQSKVFVY
jgi:hypothetical protein